MGRRHVESSASPRPSGASMQNAASTASVSPEGWVCAKIGDVAELLNGYAFKSTDWRENGIPIIRIQNLNKPGAGFNCFDGELPPRFRVKRGDLLFAWSGTPGTSFGAHLWRGRDAWLNQHIFKVIFDEQLLDKEFLKAALNHNVEQYVAEAQGGGGLGHITKSRLLDSTFSLPPLLEQRRIVAAMRSKIAKIQKAENALNRVQQNLVAYRDALLKQAFAKPFPRATVAQVISDMRHGTSAKTNMRDNGIPVLRMGNIVQGRLVVADLRYLPRNHPEFPDLLLRPGDVLFNRTNSAELVGKTAVYQGLPSPCSFASYLIRLRMSEVYEPEFLSLYLNSIYGRRWIASVASQQTGQANVSGAKLKALSIPLPSSKDQRRIVAKLHRQLASITKRESTVLENLEKAKQLKRSLLRSALQGSLVPRHLNDASSQELLERIKASKKIIDARLTAEKSHQMRRRPTTASGTKQPLLDVLKAPPEGPDARAPVSGSRVHCHPG